MNVLSAMVNKHLKQLQSESAGDICDTSARSQAPYKKLIEGSPQWL